MGFFDLFRRKPAGYVFPDAATVTNQAALRRQHYEYAHRALPGVSFANPAMVATILASPNATRFLTDLWLRAAELSEQAGLPADRAFRPPAPLRRLKDQTAWYVLSMPQPLHSPEAFLVALAFQPRADSKDWNVTCHTLELTLNYANNQPTTVVCGWTADGTHHNYQQLGVPPEPEAFLDALWKLA